MKLSVVIAGSQAPPTAFVVWRGFEESIQKAAEFGYHGVELALKSADEVEPQKLSLWLSKANIEVSAISTGQVFASLGLYFTHPEPEMRKQVIEVFTGLIQLAKDFGRLLNVGRVRGLIAENQTRSETERLFIDTAARLCDIAAEHDVTIVIEPVNRYEINFVNSVDEGAAIVQDVQRDNIGLMPDVFHMNIEDAKIGETLFRYKELIKYIHFADSNRWAPGQGHLNFDEIFEALKKAQFDGWAAIEILPKPDPDVAAKQAVEYILPKMKQYGLVV